MRPAALVYTTAVIRRPGQRDRRAMAAAFLDEALTLAQDPGASLISKVAAPPEADDRHVRAGHPALTRHQKYRTFLTLPRRELVIGLRPSHGWHLSQAVTALNCDCYRPSPCAAAWWPSGSTLASADRLPWMSYIAAWPGHRGPKR